MSTTTTDTDDGDNRDGDIGADDAVHTESSDAAGDEATSDGATGKTGTEATEETGDERTNSARAPRRWLVGMASLGVLFIVLVVAGALLLSEVLGASATTERRSAIMKVAHDVAVRSYSLDFTTFDDSSKHIIEQSTGKYREGLVKGGKGLRYILDQGKVKSTGTVTSQGIEHEDGHSATVLFGIRSEVTNTEIKNPQVRQYRVAIKLIYDGNRWLVTANDVIA